MFTSTYHFKSLIKKTCSEFLREPADQNEALLRELNLRAQIAQNRRLSGMIEQADQDDEEIRTITRSLVEHPIEYEGPCECKACMSYD